MSPSDFSRMRDILADQIRQMLRIPLARVTGPIAAHLYRRADHVLAQMGLAPK